MDWRGIAAIMFVCTAVNHLGLISAIERVIKHSLPVINCPKCFTFWSVLAYEVWYVGFPDIHIAFAISLLCSYLAIWLELLMYAIDTLYNRIYVKIENVSQEYNDESE